MGKEILWTDDDIKEWLYRIPDCKIELAMSILIERLGWGLVVSARDTIDGIVAGNGDFLETVYRLDES